MADTVQNGSLLDAATWGGSVPTSGTGYVHHTCTAPAGVLHCDLCISEGSLDITAAFELDGSLTVDSSTTSDGVTVNYSAENCCIIIHGNVTAITGRNVIAFTGRRVAFEILGHVTGGNGANGTDGEGASSGGPGSGGSGGSPGGHAISSDPYTLVRVHGTLTNGTSGNGGNGGSGYADENCGYDGGAGGNGGSGGFALDGGLVWVKWPGASIVQGAAGSDGAAGATAYYPDEWSPTYVGNGGAAGTGAAAIDGRISWAMDWPIDMPAEADVKNGVAYDVASEGTYEGGGGGGDYPTTSDVRHAVTYANGTMTGLCYVPAPADVRNAVNVGTTTGLAYIPAAADVRNAVNVDATVGTCYVPVASNVRKGVSVDATVGTLVGCVDADGVNQGAGLLDESYVYHAWGIQDDDGVYGGATGILDEYVGYHATGILLSAGVYHGTGIFDGTNYHATTGLSVGEVEDGVTWDDGDGSHEGTYDPLAAAVWPAEANVSTVEATWGPTGAEYAGTLDLSLYTLKSSVVGAAWVVSGHDNYAGGSAGTYPTEATSKAAQLAADQAVVLAAAASIKDDATVLGQAGTYDFLAENNSHYAMGAQNQYNQDFYAVTLKADKISDDTSILGVDGTLDVAALEAAAAAAQLATDQAAVLANDDYILLGHSILSQPGAFDFEAMILTAYNSGEAHQLIGDKAAVLASAGAILEGTTLLAQPGALDADLVLVSGGGTVVLPDAEEVLADVGYGASGTQYTGTLVTLPAGVPGADPEDELLAVLAALPGLSDLPARKIHLLADDQVPAITIEREKTAPSAGDGYVRATLRVGFWASTEAESRDLADLAPAASFEHGDWAFTPAGRESGLGLPKPAREEHACFTALSYLAEN
ncbi:MAG: hypothetical protein PHU85_00170 [Phycisphaerae bacterium]|nr:hypothetical protein [Phycisphaerae bacterium]